MVHDPRRDSRAQRSAQLDRRNLYPAREVAPPPPPHVLTEEDMLAEQPSLEEVEAEDQILMPAHFTPTATFFEELPQETTIHPLDWNENHPLWLAFKKGDVRMATLDDGSVHIIDRKDDVIENLDDKLPRQKYAKGDFVEMDRLASLAQLQYILGKTMVAYGICDFATVGVDQTGTQLSPLNQVPTQASVHVPPVGGAILTGELDIGFEGAGQHIVFDLPPGEIVKIPFAGSFGKLAARLRPKYYPVQDDGVAHTRVYLAFPGGPVLTSELWNSLPPSIMAQNNFPNPNPQNVRGWISEGILSNDVQGKPIRRFFGTVPGDGTAGDWHVTCPIAFAASHVMLNGGVYDPAAPTTTSVQFLFLLPPTSTIAAPTSGPFNVGQLIPIPYNAQGIVVIQSPNPVGGGIAGIVEVPFELDYFLSP